MKNPFEVLRVKELELQRVKKEVEALRTIAPMLAEGGERPAKSNSENHEVIDMP